MYEQIVVFAVITITLLLFIDGRFRYDMISISGLLILSLLGIIPIEKTFSGFSHPAVITVASVLIISEALLKVGVMDHITSMLNRDSENVRGKIFGLMAITALLSGFMNNVGALAIILPIAMGVAKESHESPSKFLMPVAFASLLGGMLTSIGTPPNLIVSMARQDAGLEPFGFFDFSFVGLPIIIIGVLFIALIGWRLIPIRKSKEEESTFKTEDYLSEVVVTKDSKVVGKTLREIFNSYKFDVELLSIIRGKRTIVAPKANQQLLEGDILLVKAVASELGKLTDKTGMELKGAKLNFLDSKPYLKSDNIELVEVVLRSDSFLIGRTSMETRLRNKYNVNVVAVSREGHSSFERLKSFRFKAGDILLLQVPTTLLEDTYNKLGCLPLAEREIPISTSKTKRNQMLTLGFFGTAIMLTSLGFVPVQLAFATTAVLLVVFNVITARDFYNSIEWPTIIILASLLPLGDALQSSGASDTIANLLAGVSNVLPAWAMIVVIMTMTMILTNLIGNSASAVLMAPIALSLSVSMGVSPDPFLMSVSIAASSAFMTPIGHQSNMLVMGPGGYEFTDYWKLGLPLSLLVIGIGTPLLMYFWPL